MQELGNKCKTSFVAPTKSHEQSILAYHFKKFQIWRNNNENKNNDYNNNKSKSVD